jgi:hypothetical protein
MKKQKEPCKYCAEFIKKYPLERKQNQWMLRISEGFYQGVPVCAFDNKRKVFSKNNWSCMSMFHLRGVIEHLSSRYYGEDCSVGVISAPISIRLGDWIEPEKRQALIVLSWYKNRGKTSQAFVLFDEEMLPLTMQNAYEIIEHYPNIKEVE